MARVMTLATMTKTKKSPKGETLSLAQEPIVKVLTETDEQILARLRDRFEILDDMTRAVKKGAVRAMIVTGPRALVRALV